MAKNGRASRSRGLEQLRINTAALGPHYNEHIDRLCNEATVEGAVYMKTHARWRDNDGNRKDRVPGAARAGLHAYVGGGQLQHDHGHKEITLSHGPDIYYGIFLETKDHGKFAIIVQSLKAVGESLMAKLEGSLARTAREK